MRARTVEERLRLQFEAGRTISAPSQPREIRQSLSRALA